MILNLKTRHITLEERVNIQDRQIEVLINKIKKMEEELSRLKYRGIDD